MNTATNKKIPFRKAEHLRLCLDDRYQVESDIATGFQELQFVHCALPELALSEIDTSITWLGYKLALPFFISPMTGGSEDGFRINRDLALAAQEARVAVGMGSMRVLFDYPEVLSHFQLKKYTPDVPLIANIGAVQLTQYSPADIIQMVQQLEADALSLHLNCGQELFQPRGDRDYRGIKRAIAQLRHKSPFPLIVKETGFGIDPATIRWLLAEGIDFVDVAGAGGSNWIRVENYRSDGVPQQDNVFNDWGIPTAYIVATLRDYPGHIIASGGIRNALDIAKALALGAHTTASALPLIRTLSQSGSEGVVAYLARLRRTLLSIMVLTSCRSIEVLRQRALIRSPHFAAQVAQLSAFSEYVDSK